MPFIGHNPPGYPHPFETPTIMRVGHRPLGTPFIFKVKVAIPNEGGTIYEEFMFVDRKEIEDLRTNIRPLGAHVVSLAGYTPTTCNAAMRKIADITGKI